MVEYVYTTIPQIMFHKRTYLLERKLFATFFFYDYDGTKEKKTDGIPKSKDQREKVSAHTSVLLGAFQCTP